MLTPACANHRGPIPQVVQLNSASPQPPEASTSDDVKREVVELVIRAQREYLEYGNPKPFADLLSPNAKIIASRRRAPGPFDSVFTKERLNNIHEWIAAHESRMKAHYVTVEAIATLDAVEMEIRLEDTSKEQPTWFGQKFRLEKSDGAWHIVRFHYWPINPETKLEFTTDFFDQLDKRIEEATQAGDDRNTVYYLVIAYRFDECAVLSRRVTDADPSDPWAWKIRAIASAMIGDKKDADESSQIARDLETHTVP